jgi:signal transduction histidine kinase
VKPESFIQVQAEHRLAFPAMLAGIAVSAVLVIWVAVDAPGTPVIRWLALAPGIIALATYWLALRTRQFVQPSLEMAQALKVANETLRQQVQDLTKLRDVMLAIGATFDRKAILDELTNALMQLLNFDRGLALLFDDDEKRLVFGAYSHAAPDTNSQFLLEQLQIDLDNFQDDPLLSPWMAGKPVLVDDIAPYLPSRLNWLLTTLDLRQFYSIPLLLGDRFKGVILADNTPTSRPISVEQRSLLDALATNIAITLENARLYQLTDDQLNARVHELSILSQIDRELNDALSVDRVLNLTLDWALRFTGSHAASVALIDQDAGEMEFVSGYGYDIAHWNEVKAHKWPLNQGIIGRVARHSEAEIIADAAQDPDYLEILPGTQSQLAVPVMRKDRVIAVLSLESRLPNAFSEANLDFAKRLAARAAVAIDNARLFGETQREREKLEVVLSSTADAVIVVDHDSKLVLVNQAAIGAFRLDPKEQYNGRAFADVFGRSPLHPHYIRARRIQQGLIEELNIGERSFHVSLTSVPQVGWSVVMHDVTPFKETEKLKNELVATTSHDLKNPLSAIWGYLDLIRMTNNLNERGMDYAQRAERSITHMRDLIDDLLDRARIESGLELDYVDVDLASLVSSVVENFSILSEEKAMTVTVDIPPDVPTVCADEKRLGQILGNLISNAIKYTPPEGHVWVHAEPREGFMQIAIQDNGMGISPEDQAQVFTRFYRVRNEKTEGIEGTGLGLAIVKSLVEAHGGQIGLESRLGEGTTFFFTLPYNREKTASPTSNQTV